MSATAEQQELLRLQMIQLVTTLARTLVDEPEEVRVEAVPESNGTMLRLHVAAGDLGKVIGKQGRTARSIRTLLAAASMKAQHRFSLDIQQIGLPSIEVAGSRSQQMGREEER